MKRLVLFCATGVLAFSCVNKDYDLSKIDGTAVIMKDISMPIGSLEKITISQILTVDDQEMMVIKDENGDYALQFKGTDPISAELTVPSFAVPLEDGSKGDDHILTINSGPLSGLDGTLLDQQIHLLDQTVEKIIKISDDDLLPYQINDIKEIETHTVIDYNFSVSAGAVHLGEGFQMDFPDWLTIEKYDTDPNYVVENESDNKNIVKFTEDVKVNAENPYVIRLVIKKIVVPEGCVVDGGNDSEGRPCKKISINEDEQANKIIANGDVYLDTKDFPAIPPTVDLEMHISFSDFKIKKALVSLNMQMAVPDQIVEIGEYPDFFRKEGVVLDMHNAYLNFLIDNQLPLALDLNADFIAYKGTDPEIDIKLGTGTGAYPFHIPASWKGTVSYSRLGNETGVIAIPEIGDIFTVMPDKVAVSNIKVTSSKDFITIEPDQNFLCSLDYELYAPLAFGKDFKLVYDMDINDIGLDLKEAGVKAAEIKFNVENSIPLDFKISAIALDAEGNSAEGMSLQVDGYAASGSIASPKNSPISISVTSDDAGITLASLRLKMTATCPSEQYQGVPLNENQGLKVSSLHLSVPEGITIDLNNIFNADPSPESGE